MGVSGFRFSDYLERETGLEPATLCLEGRYSSQLSYSRPSDALSSKFIRLNIQNGGQGRIRTFVDVSQRIYSPPPLATRAPTQIVNAYSEKFGAGYGTRTRNLLITNQLLYQLS